ncbi:MAG: CHAT domain-containing protein [Rubrivivax sp.]
MLIAEIEFIELYEDLAIGAARAMGHAMAAEDTASGVRWSPPILRSGQGGRLRRAFDTDRSWDQRIEIVEDADANMLRFNVTTNRARSEDTLSTGQLALADLFVDQAGAGTVADQALSNTLFELLLPPTFKEIAPDQRDMVLVVDQRSARFPWELLHDQRSQNNAPVAIESGIVRQLKTRDFRLRPVHSTGDTALVIGNPDLAASLQFGDLPGARSEAAAVRDALRARWATDDVVALIDALVAPIVAALHSKPWRVLHLAGMVNTSGTTPPRASRCRAW